MFIASDYKEKLALRRSAMFVRESHLHEHVAPTERKQIRGIGSYKHVAPPEQKQTLKYIFQTEPPGFL